jgi:23S rRNA (adenine2030-N6)-methyltransferase
VLSYRHAFHAGGAADVLKHAVYAFTLAYAARKAKPLYVLDTHAGAGVYDLDGSEAARTGEHRAGIARLAALDAPPPALVAGYLELVRAANPDGPFRTYPGSPDLARAILRPQDRLELAELHPTDHTALATRFQKAARIRVARTDGLALLLARMPPPERRAVVLIDPSYELKGDYEAVVGILDKAYRRFATGIYLLWYPVIERARVEELLRAVGRTGLRAVHRSELCLLPDSPGHGMTGSGLLVVNPPWPLPEAAEAGVPWLAQRLGAQGPLSVGWVAPP